MKAPEKEELYPLLFEPFYKKVLWGGDKLASKLKRPVTPDMGPIGESWEICDRPGIESRITNGSMAGATLHDLLECAGADVVGPKYQGERFPLLVKLIDSKKNLSMQVHPQESYCSENPDEHCEPKTEMWYILDADPGAKIYAGLKSTASRQLFLSHMNSAAIENDIQCFDSIPGDAYFINAGRVHAIGAGNLILEISQNSNTTFRLYDWGRTDANGKPRELHLEQSAACMDFMDRSVPRISGACDTAKYNRKYPVINRCPFFQCDDLRLVDEWRDDTASTGSFHILTPVNAPISVQNRRFTTEVPAGYSVLVPACFGRYIVKVTSGITTTVIRTTL